MSVCAAPTCSHQSFDGSSYYVDVDVDVVINAKRKSLVYPSRSIVYPRGKIELAIDQACSC